MTPDKFNELKEKAADRNSIVLYELYSDAQLSNMSSIINHRSFIAGADFAYKLLSEEIEKLEQENKIMKNFIIMLKNDKPYISGELLADWCEELLNKLLEAKEG